MSIDIDFTMSPPTPEEISKKREQAVIERAVYKKKNIRFAIVFFLIVAMWATFLIAIVIPMIAKAEPDWGIIVYFFPYVTFIIFIIANEIHTKKIEKPSKVLDKTIAQLTEGSVDEASSIINDKVHPEEIASYLEQVRTLGRLVVRVELDAIQKWHETKNLAD